MKIHTKPNDDLPAVHYTMGGTWVDYNLQTTIPGCFSIGVKLLRSWSKQIRSFSFDAGLADGYFVLPYTRGLFITRHKWTYIY
jgi:succinate dehydrogenase / fumarate reductase flavoprotein subunit